MKYGCLCLVTESVDIDIYTMIANQIAIEAPIET